MQKTKNKHIPQRTCICCRKVSDKENLLRFVVGDKVELDIENKLEGRGYYICKDISCVERLAKNKGFLKKFGKENTLQIASLMEAYLNG